MRDVVRIHPGADRRLSLPNHAVGTTDHAQAALAGDDSDAVIASGPLAQYGGCLIGRGVIQNDELKLAEGLVHNTLDAVPQVVLSVVDGHHDTE